MSKQMTDRIKKLEELCITLADKINMLENNMKLNAFRPDSIIINIDIEHASKQIWVQSLDKEEICKTFKVDYIHKLFTQGNRCLYAGIYNKHLFLYDTKKQLDAEIISFGMSE